VQGNYIGTDITGLIAIGNYDDGIRDEGNGNLIAGQIRAMATSSRAIRIWASGSMAVSLAISCREPNRRRGGRSDADGQRGGWVGIANVSPYQSDPSGNLVGGLDPGDGNIIAYNRSGVDVYSGYQIAIFSNSIFNNVGLGIDLAWTASHPMIR